METSTQVVATPATSSNSNTGPSDLRIAGIAGLVIVGYSAVTWGAQTLYNKFKAPKPAAN